MTASANSPESGSPEREDATTPPTLPLSKQAIEALADGEAEWMRNRLSKSTNVSLLVQGDMGPREIGKLIRLLEAQKAVLEDEDTDEAA